MEDYLECEFFVIRRKVKHFLEKERFESFTKAFTGGQKIFCHNLFIIDSLSNFPGNSHNEFWNKNNVTKRSMVSIGNKKIRLKNLDYPFLSLPLHLKQQFDRTLGVWRTIDIRGEILWSFKSLNKKIVKGKNTSIPKKKFLTESVRFLNFHTVRKKINISDKIKSKIYAFFLK